MNVKKRCFKVMALLCLSVIGWSVTAMAEGTQTWTATRQPGEGVTRDWTATRQPDRQDKPLHSGKEASSFSLFDGETTPLSLGILAPVQLPWGDWDVKGLRVSLLYGRCADLTGLDIGVWNTVDEDLIGWQTGVVNAASRVRGLQIGVINMAVYLKGLQVGLINYAEGARGLQVGLINVITNTTPGGFPIVYGSF